MHHAFYVWLKNFSLAIAWSILIIVLSLVPGRFLPDIPDFYHLLKPDKLIHLALFGTLSFLILQAIRKQYNTSNLVIIGTIIAFNISLLLGALTEYLQYIGDINRSGNIYDFIANTVGSLLGVLVFIGYYRKKRN